MSKPFDATLKTMLEVSPSAWPQLFKRAGRDVSVIDADTSTVSGAADKVLLVRGEPNWIHHLEFQTGPDRAKARKLNVYNSVLEDRHRLHVRTSLILLRPEANLRSLTGRYECRFPEDREPYRVFCYDVLRVWELPVEEILSGGIGVLPLAPISRVEKRNLPYVLKEMKNRIESERTSDAGQLWTSTMVLMGLRYEAPFAHRLLQEILGMEESTTYQAIVEKGRAEGRNEGTVAMRTLILELGQDHFGSAADKHFRAALDSIDKLEELQALAMQINHVGSWNDLLAGRSKRGRKKSGH